MKKMIFTIPLVMIFISIVPTVLSAKSTEIYITRGQIRAAPVAISRFQVSSSEMQEIAEKITNVIESNLKSSGLFRLIDRKAHIQKQTSLNRAPRFRDWRLIKAKAVVVGRVSLTGAGRLKAEFRLWDVILNKQLTGQAITAARQNWRKIGHLISDAIYKRMTGEKGYFNSKIVYIDESGPKDRRVKRLAIMDQDGANVRFLTDGQNLVLTPRFSPKGQKITYMSYVSGKPQVFLYNIKNGNSAILGNFPGMAFAPRFSPDGSKIIMSLSKQGATNLYSMDLNTNEILQLTWSQYINTAPCFSPDGRNIVFESDRESGQQLYVMNATGGYPKRISNGEGRYSTPVWSPRGDYIAFTKLYAGRFLIGVMRPDGSGERILTEGYHNEGPTWSPNGRVLMFFRETRGAYGGPGLYSVDLTGYNEQQVPTPSFGSDPAWGPLIR